MLSLTVIVFSIVEIKILLETIQPPAHYGKGEKSEGVTVGGLQL